MNATVAKRVAASWLAGLALASAQPRAAAQDSAASGSAPARPRIGLVLGGGGAKGAAHIGVLRVLDELRMPVDCVAGTSMGALVGGTFASGMPAEEIERIVRGIDWSQTVGSEGLRDRTPIDRKLSGIAYTNSLEFGYRDGALRTPRGLLKTQDIEDVIRGLVSDARFTRDFDDLPIPFRAVATDMVAGELVVLSSGDLAAAMRASMAVPGAFSPVEVRGMLLSDGGLMRNLPVDVARDLCADVVIAVWLQSPPPTEEELGSPVALAGRSVDVMIEANQRAQVATLTDRDVGIAVPMGDVGSSDFQRVGDAIPLGRAAAEAVSDKLSRYSVPDAEYAAWRRRVAQPYNSPGTLAAVRITGLERVNPEYVRTQMQNSRVGAAVTREQITEDTRRVFALGDFERVDYRLSGPVSARELEIRAFEKSWGPDFLRFDLGLAADFGGTLQGLLRLDHTRTWMNPSGGQWHSELQLGTQSSAGTDFYQPIDRGRRVFIQPRLAVTRNYEDVYDDGERIAEYYTQEEYGQLDVGLNFGTRAQLRAGLRSGWIQARRETGPRALPDLDRELDSSVQVQLVYDTRDAVGLATRGTFLNARYVHSGSWLGGEQDYDLAEGVVVKSLRWRGDSLALAVGGGAELSGSLPSIEQFQLGGLRTYPGLRRGELRGSSYWYAGSFYNWKLADIQSLFGQALFAGLRLQAGRVGERIDQVDDGTLFGIAGSLSGRTPAGTFLLSLGYVDNGSVELQFGVGRPVREGTILDDIR